jgi:hypothetical protein
MRAHPDADRRISLDRTGEPEKSIHGDCARTTSPAAPGADRAFA